MSGVLIPMNPPLVFYVAEAGLVPWNVVVLHIDLGMFPPIDLVLEEFDLFEMVPQKNRFQNPTINYLSQKATALLYSPDGAWYAPA